MPTRFLKIGRLKAALIAVGFIGVATAALLPFRGYANTAEVALLLVLVVLVSATLFGSRAGLLSAIAGILSFNFFLLPPFYTLSISGAENWIAFAAFIVTALIAGQLSGYARRRAEESERLYKELQA